MRAENGKAWGGKLLTFLLALSLCLGQSPAPGIAPAAVAAQAAARLKAPTVTVKKSGYEGLRLSWGKVSGAKSYDVYRADRKNGSYEKIASVRKTSYADKKIAQNQAYYYKVKARNSHRASGYSAPKSGKIQTTISPSKAPAYKGSPYVTLRGNEPSFSSWMYSKAKESYEEYESLDSLGRCGITCASVGPDTMPAGGSANTGSVEPTGWHAVQYDSVDGGYLYNRCHLIGFQLTGENANEKNLITGTRYLNLEGMLPFENMVADYVRETGNHVLYRSTPVFEEDDLVARGVELEAASVEDHGKALSFHVYLFNVQPGIQIDYATGESSVASGDSGSGSAQQPDDEDAQQPDDEDTQGAQQPDSENAQGTQQPDDDDPSASESGTYVLNTNTRKFHLPTCSSVKRMSEANKETYEGNRDDVIDMGYEPCKICNP